MNYRFSNRLLSLLTGGTIVFSLSGCSNEKGSSSLFGSDTYVFVKPATTVTNIVTTTRTTTVIPSTEIASSYIESDDVVLGQFKAMGSSIKSSFNSSDLLDKGKLYFIYCVDFLFYDGEIKGVKFSELSEMAKKQLISDIITIDDLICCRFPNYKETISEKSAAAYDKASEIIHSGSVNVKDYSREKLGDDNYMKIKEYKDLFVEQTSQDWNEFTDIIDEGYEKGKSKIKEWYENFRKEQ